MRCFAGDISKYYESILRNILHSYISGLNLMNKTIKCLHVHGRELRITGEEYALVRGPEILLTCYIDDFAGQVFTVAPRSYTGRLLEILKMNLDNVFYRGIFYATINALVRYLGLLDKSCHCTNGYPELCGRELARFIIKSYGTSIRVLHAGYHPGHIVHLYNLLKDNILITDLSLENIWNVKYNRMIYDGMYNDIFLNHVDLVLITGSSIINRTFWRMIHSSILSNKEVIVYGISATGAIILLKKEKILPQKIKIFCPFSK